ncbi:cysteine-tryptophan domain-containing zinc finger protein 3 [Lactuca sativa]|uniref:CW-type domain-containing protein n=1 Tax=Lactuca sativa TaxID=4236 RepID=A0A9R1VGS5_LACSA|nr:cysteine-tryptophan domain-containing zinc finger protein 3 [Lactuca sativa]KAJ0205925.1 hypothetical protein LSAT_V11C500246330 [Lactuca sativa]
MEETELEEGEACFDDNDASIDPDTALSYIDQRLQNVLGHFQKDFEGGMSAEILGPKFGGYGSFLPSYKQVPTVHSHSKTPQTVQNFNKSCLESAPVNAIIPTKPVLAVRPPATSSFHVSKNETTTSNSANPSEQRSLKVRIKVSSDKSARKNAAIYSGLGLSSPSSSMGNDHHDHEDSDCLLTESHHIPLDSPDTILRDMTSVIVPGNRLLSPLNESLLCLKKVENKPTPPVIGRKIGLSSFVDDSSSILGEGKPMEGKEVSSQDKSEMKGMKYNESGGFEAEKARFSGKESFDSKQCSTSDLKVNLSSKSVLCKENGAAKKDVPVKKRETNKEWLKDRFFGSDFKESDSACGQDHDVIHSSSEETKTKTKKFSLDTKGSDRTKGKTVNSVCKNDPGEKNVEKKVGLKAMTREPHEVKATHSITKLPLERKSKLMGIIQPGAMKDNKSAQKDIVKVRNSYKDILDMRVNDDNTQRHEERHIPVNGLPAESAIQVVPAAPSDHWVGCDRCEKWRLLPIGIEPENLPDKWLCSMSTWLPGRNSCDISEDETTRAVQEMNIHLMSQNQNQNLLQYNGSGAISGLASENIRYSDHINSNVNSEAMPLKKNNSRPEGISHLSQKRKTLSEANQEKNMVNKSNNFAIGRHAAKVNEKDVNEGGDLKPKKLKSKTGSDPYDHVTSSNLKTEAAPHTDGYKDNLVISVKRQPESTELSMKSKLLGTEKMEMHAKKRKLKDWEESQPSEGNNDRIGRKEKRLKSSNNEINDSTAIKENDRSTLKGKTMKIILPGSKENSVDRKLDKHREKVTSRKNLEIAATSSSSKVSDSCRRVSLQKGSPVGSVSSSPIRALSHANLSPSVRTISRKSGKGAQIPRKLLPREDNTKGISVIDASQRFTGKVELKQKEVFKIMEDNANDAMIPQSSGKESLPKSREKDKKCSFQRVKVKGSEPLTELTKQEPFPNKMRKVEVDVDRCRSSMNPEYSNTKISNDDKDILGKKISRKRTGDEKEKPTSLMMMSHGGCEAKLGGIGSSEVKKDPKKVFLGDISKKKDLNEVEQKVEGGNLNVKSVVNDCGTMKDLGVIGFVKEYASSQTALTAFKRAEDSKDYADRIKISGFDYECNDAYFDSALKFLYAASLLESCSNEFNKSKGVDPVNIYTTSAKLSKNCAQEYEKQKEMAAAALAYKCMEVAYMRIVYCKSSVTRQDLQTSLQMVNQGESPSSSASDVDNLNNQATMDKSVLSNKSIAHPGHHLVARNQANFLRLLDFTGDVNLAMEASTNTQNSYKAAAATSITQESPNKEIMISIKKVIEFSFQDVKEVVFLVQNAREAINRQGFKGKNIKNRE